MDGTAPFFFTAPELIACGAFAAALIWLAVAITIKDVRLLGAILPDSDQRLASAAQAAAGRVDKPLPVFAAAQRMIVAVDREPPIGG